ncbi:MAG: phosphatase PAP2 family protein [Elusimicrobia bacterium]|nr:phosphatase PAP2 family protein [Elusimicrobiota bacterium]
MALSREDRWLAFWLLAALLIAAGLFAVNAFFFRYTGISYFPRECWWLAFVALDLAVFGYWIRDRSPHASFASVNLAFYALTAAVMGVLTTAIQYSPFPRIDDMLASWDASLGWDTVAVLRRVSERPSLRSFLNLCYNSTELQLALAPFVAALAHDRRRLRVLLYGTVYSSIAGSLFYYFFPSSGPAGVFQSPDFLPVQRLTHLKFEQVHHFQPVTTLLGGLIAFPSFHVAWSVLATYAALPRPRLFAAALILNAFVIASTVLLGWHYLVDLPAGILLALSCLWAGEVTHREVCDGPGNEVSI